MDVAGRIMWSGIQVERRIKSKRTSVEHLATACANFSMGLIGVVRGGMACEDIKLGCIW